MTAAKRPSGPSPRAQAEARAVLHSHGLRCTAPRLAVTAMFYDSPQVHHLTAQEIADRLAQAGTGVDLSTVYRNLTSLVELGVLHALTVADRTATFGLARAPHHHAVCTHCGAVIEIPAEQLAHALRQAARGSHFQLAPAASLTLHGTCPDCRTAGHSDHS